MFSHLGRSWAGASSALIQKCAQEGLSTPIAINLKDSLKKPEGRQPSNFNFNLNAKFDLDFEANKEYAHAIYLYLARHDWETSLTSCHNKLLLLEVYILCEKLISHGAYLRAKGIVPLYTPMEILKGTLLKGPAYGLYSKKRFDYSVRDSIATTDIIFRKGVIT
jgi:hypothetical protein